MKVCGSCKENKPETDFAMKSKTTGRLQSSCRKCQQAYRKSHYEANHQKYRDKAIRLKEKYKVEFYTWLQTQQCVDCGNDDFRVLEFDHLRDKEFNIGEMVGLRTLAGLQDEIAKCEIVCANCHKIRSADRGNFHKYLRV